MGQLPRAVFCNSFDQAMPLVQGIVMVCTMDYIDCRDPKKNYGTLSSTHSKLYRYQFNSHFPDL